MEGLLGSLRRPPTRPATSSTGRFPDLRAATDDGLIAVLSAAAGVHRLLDAIVVAAVDEVERRSDTPDVAARLTHHLGCASVSELLQRVTRVSAATAARWQRVASAVRQETSLHGEPLDATLPALRAALFDGEVGVDGALAIAGPLLAVRHRAAADEMLAADAELAAAARGDRAPAPSADSLRVQAQA